MDGDAKLIQLIHASSVAVDPTLLLYPLSGRVRRNRRIIKGVLVEAADATPAKRRQKPFWPLLPRCEGVRHYDSIRERTTLEKDEVVEDGL